MTAIVKDTDRGAKKRLVRLLGLGEGAIRVGILGAEAAAEKIGSGGTTTLVEVAEAHEFGLGNNPERSFLRAWFDGMQLENEILVERVTEQMFQGNLTRKQGMGLLGAHFVGEIQKFIADRIDPPLRDETIRRKQLAGTGGDVPLIARGQVRSSITWGVI